jgi:hypothetical protein
MDKVAVKPAVSVLERMDINKAEGKDRRRNHRIDMLSCGAVEGDQAINERCKVFVPRTDMVWQRHAAIPVVLANKAAFNAQSQAYEAGVANHDPLQAQEFVKIE